MLDEKEILKAAAEQLDDQVKQKKPYEKQLQPYVDVIEYGIQLGLLDGSALRDRTLLVCEDAIEDAIKLVTGKEELDTEDWQTVSELGKEILAGYEAVDIGLSFLLNFGGACVMEVAPHTLAGFFGKEKFEAVRHQKELDKLVQSEKNENLLSI